jgi:hypothetical protein
MGGDVMLRDVPLQLSADGLTVVQPHRSALTKMAKQQGYVVLRIQPEFKEYAQAIVDAINNHMPTHRTGRSIGPEDMTLDGRLKRI